MSELTNGTLPPANLASITRWGEAEMIQFVKFWQTSKDIAEVASKTGLTPSQVYAKGRKCSKAGLNLKKLDRGAMIDWEKVKREGGL